MSFSEIPPSRPRKNKYRNRIISSQFYCSTFFFLVLRSDAGYTQWAKKVSVKTENVFTEQIGKSCSFLLSWYVKSCLKQPEVKVKCTVYLCKSTYFARISVK